MDRRSFLERVGTVSTGLLLTGYGRAAEGAAAQRQAGAKKPNILFVFADQLRYSALGSSGNKVVRTPHLDRLAAEGLVFENAFANHPLCSPYRANLLTGKYGWANGVPDNEYVLWDNQVTLPQALKTAGYRSAFIGKWHLGTGPYPTQKRYGFDYLFASNCPNRHYGVIYHRNEAGPIKMDKFSPEGETDEAIRFIEDHRKAHGDAPFAVVVGWEPPHWPYDQYPQEFNTYDPARVDLPPNVPVQMAEFARREIAQYYGNVSALDAQMGRLLEALARLGIADNTIVCFSSDHGDHLSSHGYGKPMDNWMHPTMRASKATPYEESVHIPFLLRYPRVVTGGRRTRALFGSVDVMPTLLALCGVAIPQGVQGHNLAHIVTGTDGATPPDSVYLINMGTGWPNRARWVGCWRGVRTDRWVYARWNKPDEHAPVLFDRQNDPYELNNLAGNPAFADVQQGMEARLKKWMADTGDPFETGRRDEKGMLDLPFQLQPRWSRPAAFVSRGFGSAKTTLCRHGSERACLAPGVRTSPDSLRRIMRIPRVRGAKSHLPDANVCVILELTPIVRGSAWEVAWYADKSLHRQLPMFGKFRIAPGWAEPPAGRERNGQDDGLRRSPTSPAIRD